MTWELRELLDAYMLWRSEREGATIDVSTAAYEMSLEHELGAKRIADALKLFPADLDTLHDIERARTILETIRDVLTADAKGREQPTMEVHAYGGQTIMRNLI